MSRASRLRAALITGRASGVREVPAYHPAGGEAAFGRMSAATPEEPEEVLEEENRLLLREMYLSIQCLSETVQRLIEKVEPPSPSSTTLPSSPSAWEELLQQLFGLYLSETERRVCARRLIGHTASDIAAALSLSNSTVKTHTAHLVEKFSLKNAREIPFFVLRHLLERRRTT